MGKSTPRLLKNLVIFDCMKISDLKKELNYKAISVNPQNALIFGATDMSQNKCVKNECTCHEKSCKYFLEKGKENEKEKNPYC